MEEVFPQRFGPFVLLRLLGSGGMGKAYLARHAQWPGLLAVKRMHPHLLEEDTLAKRFIHEAQVAVHVRHPNVAQLMAMGTVNQEPFFATEFILGVSIAAIVEEVEVRKVEPIPLAAGLQVALGIAAGVEAIHDAVNTDTGEPLRLVHRDIGARNVLLGEDGSPRHIDLGLGKSALADWHTAANLLAGSPDYMAPEQAQGRNADERADVYSAAVTIWELLTGKKRIREPTIPLRISRALEAVPEPLVLHRRDAPRTLERLLKEAMEPSLKDRLASAKLLRQGLERELAALRAPSDPLEVVAWMERALGGHLARERRLVAAVEPQTALPQEPAETRILAAYDAAMLSEHPRPLTLSGRLLDGDSQDQAPSPPPPPPPASVVLSASAVVAERASEPPRPEAPAPQGTVLVVQEPAPAMSSQSKLLLAFVAGIALVMILALMVGLRIGQDQGAASARVEPLNPPTTPVSPAPATPPPAPPPVEVPDSGVEEVEAPLPLDVLARKRELLARLKELRRARFEPTFQKRLTAVGGKLSGARTQEELDEVEAQLVRLERL